MKNISSHLMDLSDSDLLTEVRRLTERERDATARLIASLAELDARRLYLGEGCSSLFTYCTQVLHLSEHAAYGRIEAARAARRFPLILERLADGSLTLTTVGLLARHLTAANHREVLEAARHRSKRDIEQLVARLNPRPPVPSSVRKLPGPRPARAVPAKVTAGAPLLAAPSAPPAAGPPLPPRAVVQPLAPERYKVQFTVSAETHAKLRRAQDLLRHSVPEGDPAAIFDRALTLLVAHLEKTKLGMAVHRARGTGGRRRKAVGTSAAESAGSGAKEPVPQAAEPTGGRRPAGPGSRDVPAAVRRAVWARDEGRCAFVGTHGRCRERGFLEFHHLVPYAAGGEATVDNIQVRCRRHNQYEAERYFGPLLFREGRVEYWGNSGRAELNADARTRPGCTRLAAPRTVCAIDSVVAPALA